MGSTGRSWGDRDRYAPDYPSSPAWNSDESILYLGVGSVFIDTSTWQPVPYDAPSGYTVWAPGRPSEMFATVNDQLVLWDVKRDAPTLQIAASGYRDLAMTNRTAPSNDGNRVGVKAKTSSGEWVCLGFDVRSRSIEQVISFDDLGFSSGGYSEEKARRCSVSPTGRYLMLTGYANGSYNDQAHFFDWSSGNLVMRQRANNGVECPGSHGDIGVDASGRDVLVGGCKGGSGWSDGLSGETVVVTIATGEVRSVGSRWSHVSCRNIGRPGWCYGSSYDANGKVAAFSLDGRRVEYYADPHAGAVSDYYDETKAVASPSGRKFVMSTNWDGQYSVAQAVVVDLSGLP